MPCGKNPGFCGKNLSSGKNSGVFVVKENLGFRKKKLEFRKKKLEFRKNSEVFVLKKTWVLGKKNMSFEK